MTAMLIDRSPLCVGRACIARWLLMFILGCYCPLLFAQPIDVRTDRNPVLVNESFQIIFSAEGSPDGDPDFSPLEKNFDILNRAQSNNISIINGRTSHTTTWKLTVMAKTTGNLVIPSIAFGKDSSTRASVDVQQAGQATDQAAAPDQDIMLEVDAEPRNPYVDAQVIYTIRVLRRVNFNQASLSEPEPEHAIVQKLGDDVSYNTQRNGQTYAAVERTYAIFPQHSGSLKIPALQLTAQIATGSRGFFDFGGYGVTKRLNSEAIQLQVKPIPPQFTGKHWLPASALELKENWSAEALTLGEPITRTLSLSAHGISQGQLPALFAHDEQSTVIQQAALKQYPDQPKLSEQQKHDGITSLREEKIALIATQGGHYDFPEIAIPWWNTTTDRMEIARLPAHSIAATGTGAPTVQANSPLPASPLLPAADHPSIAIPLQNPTANPWPWVSLVLALGWLTTLVFNWRAKRHGSRSQTATPDQAPVKAKQVLDDLRQACIRNDPARSKQALLAWAKLRWQHQAPLNLSAIAALSDARLAQEIERLNDALYARHASDWQGEALWQAVRNYRAVKTPPSQGATLEPLYKIESVG